MEKIIEEKYDKALKGRKIWLAYKKEYSIDDNWCLVIFPSDEVKLDAKMDLYLKEFLDKKYLKFALVLYDGEIRFSQNDKRIIFVKIGKSDLESVIYYYTLLQFHKNIVVMSLKEPFGNNHIIGRKGISLDDYIRCGLLV